MSSGTKVILITGSTDGIGRQAALELAKRSETTIIIHGRSTQRCEEALAWLRERLEGKGSFRSVVGDFGSLESVAEMAATVEKDHPDLNVLICNAGVLNPTRQLTSDGLEATFQVR